MLVQKQQSSTRLYWLLGVLLLIGGITLSYVAFPSEPAAEVNALETEKRVQVVFADDIFEDNRFDILKKHVTESLIIGDRGRSDPFGIPYLKEFVVIKKVPITSERSVTESVNTSLEEENVGLLPSIPL